MLEDVALPQKRTWSTRAELLREKLTEEIMSGRLAPGTRLDEQEIANRFGVSRTPVREAVRHLVATGLVESQPHQGATVSGFNSDRLAAFLDAATELEVACIRLAATRMDPTERANLASLHAGMRHHLLGDAERYAELNSEFHETIYAGSHNEVLVDIIHKLKVRLWPVYRVQLTLLQSARQSYSEHERIVSAILSGDAVASEVAMRAHMSSSALMLERLHGSALGFVPRDRQDGEAKRGEGIVIALDPRFAGNVPALVTPCRADGSPDLPAMGRLVEHVAAAGVSAINILGTTGEFSLVPPEHRAPIIRAAVAATKGRLAVMAGCGRPSVAETAAEIHLAATAGALAALVTPSYYFPLSDSEIIRFFTRLGESAPIPLLYYHYPQMTGCPAGASAILALARAGIIAGVKDSSGDAAFFARLAAGAAELGDFRLFIGGSGFLIGALAQGAAGVIGALSGFTPALDNELIDAVGKGDMARARRAQADITRAVDSLFASTPRNPAAIAKTILAALDLCGDAVFPPLEPLSEAERRQILGALPALGIVASPPEGARTTAPSHSP